MSNAIEAETMPRPVTALLGFIAGFVDICAYLGLFGVFVAQLTGSFVVAGARLVSGQQELMTLLAIPAFFLAGAAGTTLAVVRAPRGQALSWVLGLECVLLAGLLALMLAFSPMEQGQPAMITAALTGIAAMGVQSATVRLFMKGAPSTNVMTTNTTQLAIDTALVLLAAGGHGDPAQARQARQRFNDYWPVMAGFFLGTAIGALCFRFAGPAALATPLVAALALLGWTLSRR